MAARRVFVSYRRHDSAAVVGRICDHLVEVLGPDSVFKDVDSISPGEDFRTVLRTSIRECDAMLVVIGPQWLAPGPAGGQARLFEHDDYVRAEIEQAVAHRVTLIPVLVEEASMPSAESLPASVRDLAFRQAALIRSDPDFHSDIERLLERPPFELQIDRPSPRRDPRRSRRSIIGVRWIGVGVGLFLTVALVAVLVKLLNPAPQTADNGRQPAATVDPATSSVVGSAQSTAPAPSSTAAPTTAVATTAAVAQAAPTTAPASTTPASTTPSVTPAGGRVSAADAYRDGKLRPLDEGYIAVPSEYIDVSADSTLAPQGRFDYDAANLIDRDLETAWTEGVDGFGVGARLVFRFTTPMPFERIEVWPGWQTEEVECRFFKNARPTAMTADAISEDGETDLGHGEQFDQADPKARLVITLTPGVYTEVTLVVTAVAPGETCDNGPFEDTGISEIRFFAGECLGGYTAVDGELAPYDGPPASC